MIIHCSKDFVQRYKVRTSVPNAKNQQSRRIDSWSCHIIKMGSTPFVLFMRDAALWSLIISIGEAEFHSLSRFTKRLRCHSSQRAASPAHVHVA